MRFHTHTEFEVPCNIAWNSILLWWGVFRHQFNVQCGGSPLVRCL